MREHVFLDLIIFKFGIWVPHELLMFLAVFYFSHRHVPKLQSADECRDKCRDLDGCSFWSFISSRSKCRLYSAGAEYRANANINAVSGSVMARPCSRPKNLGRISDCSCDDWDPRRKGGDNQGYSAK